MNQQQNALLQRFEEFLESIPLEKYEQELRSVKTVEQDLPKELNPLPALYEAYWTDKPKLFPSYEQFFDTWWDSNLLAIDGFVRKYFWGCSWEFVRLGFKARLYRTAISVLTQFDFCYVWKTHCASPLNASAQIDMQGVDAEVNVGGAKAALQIKKETYRAEAGTEGRFARRQQEYPIVVEIPYTLTRPEQWSQTVERARSESGKKRAELFHFCASQLQRWLGNGFVVFQPAYPMAVEHFIKRRISESGHYDWQSLLTSIKSEWQREGR